MSKTFLLIDDDKDDIDLFSEALDEVDSATQLYRALNGKIALEVLEQNEIPDIIFLDINMPLMNGWECLKELKSNSKYKKIPVIMYSTSSHKNEIEKATKLGALRFITKPHDYQDLKKIIENILNDLKNNLI